MSALLERQILSETLTHDELAEITGCVRYGGQIAWLYENGWKHHYSRSGAPIVGRWYCPAEVGRDNATGGYHTSVVA